MGVPLPRWLQRWLLLLLRGLPSRCYCCRLPAWALPWVLLLLPLLLL